MLIIFLMRSQGIGPGTTFNPFIPTSDQEKISTHNFNMISSRQMMRIKTNII